MPPESKSSTLPTTQAQSSSDTPQTQAQPSAQGTAAAKPAAAAKKPLTADQKIETLSRQVAAVGRAMHGQDPRMHDRLSGSVYDLRESHRGLIASFVSAGTTELFAIPLTYGVAKFTPDQGAKFLAGWAEVGEAIKAEWAK